MLKVRNSGVLLTISTMLISVSVCISVTGKFAYAGNQELRVGAMGASLTDEYGADDNRSGMVWVEQLVTSQDFNFGAFSAASRGEPRRAGYEYNWARSGATATGDYSYALPRQWAGLANQVIAGEEIPLGARILAVADAFDAMVSDRPYRSAMSNTEIVAEIKRCAGTQFDPVVVNAFLNTVELTTP